MLTALEIKNVESDGKTRRIGDGRGLYLVVRESGSKSWVQRVTVDGRRTDIGLGGFPDVTLALARRKSEEIRAAIAEGRDPLAERRQPGVPTFRDAAAQYIEDKSAEWRRPQQARDWRAQLKAHAYPAFGNTRVDRITRGSVVAVLRPLWTTRPAQARKLRQRIRAVFGAAMAHGHLDLNPAGEVIDAALPKIPAVKDHFEAIPYQDVPAALRQIGASGASTAARLSFRFLVLTAARSGEVRGARWGEIDMDGRTWTIPADRMKAGVEHRVPLSDAALDVLREAKALGGGVFVFPSPWRGVDSLSDRTVTKMLRHNGIAATAHGFRTSFKTWCMESTDTPWAVGEAALAHTLGNSTEQAYARSDLFERRRDLMQQWSDFVA